MHLIDPSSLLAPAESSDIDTDLTPGDNDATDRTTGQNDQRTCADMVTFTHQKNLPASASKPIIQ